MVGILWSGPSDCLLEVINGGTINLGIVRYGQRANRFFGETKNFFPNKRRRKNINLIDYFKLPVYLSIHIKVFFLKIKSA